MINLPDQKRKKRILIISGEAWRDESNGGNVLSNIFTPMKDKFEFAQIYTNPAMPNNSICERYFHISESQLIGSFITRKSFGETINRESIDKNKVENIQFSSRISFVKKYLPNIGIFGQNLIWKYSKWKSNELKTFIKVFNPDIIFAPMYYGLFLHRIDRYVAEITGKKIISYVSDDHLTYKHFSFSPIFWLNRFILRQKVIKTANYYSLLYTMTKEQLEEYQTVLNVPMKILTKSGNFDRNPDFKEKYVFPIKLIYAGNLIYNRYKTLAKLVKVIEKINQDKVYFQLDIYTQTPITKEFKKLLHDGRNSLLNGKISFEELKGKYKEYDILLHVESLDLKQRLLTRISFSTKIVDLLHSGRTVMAICWDQSSPFKYLKREEAAICISSLSDIEAELYRIKNDTSLLRLYAMKAWDCGRRNHSEKNISKMVNDDFLKYGLS